MSLSDDDLDAVTRRQRTSLDAQRFTFMPRQPAMASPSAATPSGSSSTFLLPILLPATSVASTDIETSPVILKELSAKPDGRSSSSGAAVLPPEIANADLAIAGEFSIHLVYANQTRLQLTARSSKRRRVSLHVNSRNSTKEWEARSAPGAAQGCHMSSPLSLSTASKGTV